MLVQCNYLEEMLSQRRNGSNSEHKLHYFVSELMDQLGVEDEQQIAAALQRTLRTLESLGISSNVNLHSVYRFDGSTLFPDWKISPLAAYLLVINCDPANRIVARAQVFFARQAATL
jgi:hypothetical protein